jgi:RNA polymerase subunit RPABC4/transcription elongation factor Spt4
MWPIIGLIWTIAMFAMCSKAVEDVNAVAAPGTDANTLAVGIGGTVYFAIWVGGLFVVALLRVVFGEPSLRFKAADAAVSKQRGPKEYTSDRCRHCARRGLPDGAKVCPWCGGETPLGPEEMPTKRTRCRHCLKLGLPDGAKVCAFCGVSTEV